MNYCYGGWRKTEILIVTDSDADTSFATTMETLVDKIMTSNFPLYGFMASTPEMDKYENDIREKAQIAILTFDKKQKEAAEIFAMERSINTRWLKLISLILTQS